MSQSSELEELFLHWLHLLAPDAPEPQRQVKLIAGRKFACDFVWIGYKLPKSEFFNTGVVVEIDGIARQAGGGKHLTPMDYEKVNLLNLKGYCVLRFLGSMLRDDPYTCIAQVAQALSIKVKALDT